MLEDGGHSELRGISEQVRRARRSHTRITGADVSSAFSAPDPLLSVAPREACAGAAQSSQSPGGKDREVPYELTVVIGETHEAAHVRTRRGLGPLRHSSDLARVDG